MLANSEAQLLGNRINLVDIEQDFDRSSSSSMLVRPHRQKETVSLQPRCNIGTFHHQRTSAIALTATAIPSPSLLSVSRFLTSEEDADGSNARSVAFLDMSDLESVNPSCHLVKVNHTEAQTLNLTSLCRMTPILGLTSDPANGIVALLSNPILVLDGDEVTFTPRCGTTFDMMNGVHIEQTPEHVLLLGWTQEGCIYRFSKKKSNKEGKGNTVTNTSQQMRLERNGSQFTVDVLFRHADGFNDIAVLHHHNSASCGDNNTPSKYPPSPSNSSSFTSTIFCVVDNHYFFIARTSGKLKQEFGRFSNLNATARISIPKIMDPNGGESAGGTLMASYCTYCAATPSAGDLTKDVVCVTGDEDRVVMFFDYNHTEPEISKSITNKFSFHTKDKPYIVKAIGPSAFAIAAGAQLYLVNLSSSFCHKSLQVVDSEKNILGLSVDLSRRLLVYATADAFHELILQVPAEEDRDEVHPHSKGEEVNNSMTITEGGNAVCSHRLGLKDLTARWMILQGIVNGRNSEKGSQMVESAPHLFHGAIPCHGGHVLFLSFKQEGVECSGCDVRREKAMWFSCVPCHLDLCFQCFCNYHVPAVQ